MAQNKKTRKPEKKKKAPAKPESEIGGGLPPGPKPFTPPGKGFDRGSSRGPSGPQRERPNGRRH
jgi:hypothetical protein